MISIDIDHFRARILQDALTEATAQHWLHRAAVFAQVGTPECDLIAENCRNHAQLIAGEYGALAEPWPGFLEDLDLVLAEREAA
jgi:hypothetical protein